MAQGNHSVKRESLIETVNVQPRYPRRRIPFTVPRGQLYYWTREWREDEEKALEELERGEGVVFYNPKEAARWLMSLEDDESDPA